MGKKDKKQRVPLQSSPKATLGDALRAAGLEVPAEAPGSRTLATRAPAPTEDADPTPRASRRVHLRVEKKGRRGKTVTLVAGIEASPEDREEILRRMRRALGCGGFLEGDRLVLQGSLLERARAWLQAEGILAG